MRRLSGSCDQQRLFSSASFFLRRNRGIKVVNVGKANGSALLGVVTKLRRASRNAIAGTGRTIVTCLPRRPIFSPREATLSYILTKRERLSKPRSKRTRRQSRRSRTTLIAGTGAVLAGLNISGFSRGSNRLSNKREGHLTLIDILLGRTSVLLLSRPAGRLSRRVTS